MFERPRAGNRALLVHLDFQPGHDAAACSEFVELARSAGAEVLQLFRGHRAAPDPKYYCGSGKAAEVAAIAIQQPKGALTIERKGEAWTIAERGGFPADYDKVRDFVIKATALKIGQSDTVGDKDRERLQLGAGGTKVEFRAQDGKPLATLVAGRKYFKAEPDNPEKALGDGRYWIELADGSVPAGSPLEVGSTLSGTQIRPERVATKAMLLVAGCVLLGAFLFALWVIVLDTRAGFRSISPSLVDMARSFGASRRGRSRSRRSCRRTWARCGSSSSG